MSYKENEKDRIGIYGGSFDPIHFAHISLAVELMESCKLKEVWFCPNKISPHKLQTPPTPEEHRLNMLRLALSNIPEFKILNWELKRKAPSYTIDTLKSLLGREKLSSSPRQFYLILGEDTLSNFEHWHKAEEIIRIIPLLIGKRFGYTKEKRSNNPKIHAAIEKGLKETSVMEISSTTIRKRLRNNLYCTHLIPEKVLDYIFQNQLYSVGPKGF